MPLHTLYLDAPSLALSTSLIPAVQAAYDGAGFYPPFTVTQGYVLTGCVHVGLSWWVPMAYLGGPHPLGTPANWPTAARLAVVGSGTPTLVNVDAMGTDDVAHATAIAAYVGGGVTVDQVLGCACCTGLGMLSGVAQQVGPFGP